MGKIATIDDLSYGQLLQQALPKIIESDEENERLSVELERLDALPRMAPEQHALGELLTLLIQQFERRYDLPNVAPLEAPQSLIEDRGLRQRDLLNVFGSSSVASDVLRGKREISKQHARRLRGAARGTHHDRFVRMAAKRFTSRACDCSSDYVPTRKVRALP